MSTDIRVAAVDLGGTSGRVMLGRLSGHDLTLTEVHRVPNTPVRERGTLCWNIKSLYGEILAGLRKAGPVQGIGIDSWAVDYGLLDRHGTLLGNPVHYRDDRTQDAVTRVLDTISLGELYAATGTQFQPFNTLYQLVSEQDTARLRAAERLLLIPDLITYWLTGVAGTELTNASTTALLDPRTRRWSDDVAKRVDIDLDLFAPLRPPGERAGTLKPELDLGSTPVYAVASHDTASAVAAVPAATEKFAYISSGTWSLVGIELDEPVLTDASREANFTNEIGVDGTIRYLRNVTGLWLLQECQRAWGIDDVAGLLAEAATLPTRAIVNANDPRFLPPGDMPTRIAAACDETGQPVPETPAQFTRCILDSLAAAYRTAIDDAARLTRRRTDIVHIVGGGSRNELLCQLTADTCGRPVIAGPVEATALGNILVQARAHGAVTGGLAEMRDLVRRTQRLRIYQPRSA